MDHYSSCSSASFVVLTCAILIEKQIGHKALKSKEAMDAVYAKVLAVGAEGNAFNLSPGVFSDLQYLLKNETLLSGIVEAFCLLESCVSEGFYKF